MSKIETIAGNLMFKHSHREFPSDIFLLFETIGAQLTISSSTFKKRTCNSKRRVFYKINAQHRVLDCRIAYGGLVPNFNRATQTETFLIGKTLFNNGTLQNALKMLNNELVVTELPPEPSVKYRRKLALGLFYKMGLILLRRFVSLARRNWRISNSIDNDK